VQKFAVLSALRLLRRCKRVKKSPPPTFPLQPFKVSARWKLPILGRMLAQSFWSSAGNVVHVRWNSSKRNDSCWVGLFYVTNRRVVVSALTYGNTGEIRPPDVDALFSWGWLPGVPSCLWLLPTNEALCKGVGVYVPSLKPYGPFWTDIPQRHLKLPHPSKSVRVSSKEVRMWHRHLLKKIPVRTPNRRGENGGDLMIQVLLGCYAV